MEVKKQDLVHLLENYSTRVVAKKLGISIPTLYKLIKTHNVLNGQRKKKSKKITVID